MDFWRILISIGPPFEGDKMAFISFIRDPRPAGRKKQLDTPRLRNNS
jgi:hypothetical protein